jgi:hypothetical protein
VALERLEAIREPRLIGQRVVTSFMEQAETWLTRLFPRRWRTRQFERQVQETIEYLVARNVEELRWTTRQNLNEAFRSFQVRLEKQLDAVIENIRSTLRAVLERQAQREAAELPGLQRVEGVRHRLDQLRAVLAPPGKSTSYSGPV